MIGGAWNSSAEVHRQSARIILYIPVNVEAVKSYIGERNALC